jgi:uncharacterized protein (TIGR02147 family)
MLNSLEIQARQEAYEILQGSFMSKQPEVNIFDYVDFRTFLKEFFKEKKLIDKKYSQRFIIQKIGASSSGWFADMVSGRKKLSSTFQMRLVQLLHLGPREQQYFNSLVDYNQADTHELKQKTYQRLLDFHELKPEVLGRDHYEYFTKWYYTAIRELFLLEDFTGDYNSLSKRLIPNITPHQAKEAVVLLEKLQLIEHQSHGVWKPKNQHVSKDTNSQPIHFINYLKTNMEVAMKSLETTPKEERNFSALMVGLNEENFKLVQDELKLLKEKIKTLSAQPQEGARVYQLLIQAFPMSK